MGRLNRRKKEKGKPPIWEQRGETLTLVDEKGAAFISNPPARARVSTVPRQCLLSLRARLLPAGKREPGRLAGSERASGRRRGSPARVRDESAGPRKGCECSGVADQLGPGLGRLWFRKDIGE